MTKKDENVTVDDTKKEESTPQPDEKYTNLEKKLGELASTVEQQNQFINASSTVINTLAYTPELREHFRQAYAKQQGVEYVSESNPDQKNESESKKETPTVSDDKIRNVERKVEGVEAANRESILNDFEKDFGITKLPEEQKKEARKEISSYISDWGWRITDLPVTTLRSNLEKAYDGTLGAKKMREEGKIEGMTTARANAMGSMGSISGSSSNIEGGEADLTSKQKEWAKKLRRDPEKVKKVYLSRDDEADRVSKAEQKAEER